VGLEALGADPLHHAEALAETGEGRQEPVEGPGRDELVPASQRDQDPLPDMAPLAEGLHDLEVLVAPATLVTPLDADEHGWSIRDPEEASSKKRCNAVDFRHYILLVCPRGWAITVQDC